VSTDANPFRTPPPLSRHPVDVGHRTEAAIARRLLERGYEVLQPLGVNQRYDLVVDDGGRFLRIQCKTGRLQNGAIRFRTVSIRTNTKQILIRGYAGEIDYFGVYCPATDDVYFVPIEDAPPGSECMLRVEPTRNGQAKGIRWAREYTLWEKRGVDSPSTPE
jgi:hypothetical protein